MKKIGDRYTNNIFENIKQQMIMKMNIGMHVNYKKYWNTRIGEIFKK